MPQAPSADVACEKWHNRWHFVDGRVAEGSSYKQKKVPASRQSSAAAKSRMTLRISPSASRIAEPTGVGSKLCGIAGSTVSSHRPSCAGVGFCSSAAIVCSRRESIALRAVRLEPAAWITESRTGRLFTKRTAAMAARTLGACLRGARTAKMAAPAQ
eukprot:scaffold117510_cov32-Tisochrysis_lutea.AAC.1